MYFFNFKKHFFVNFIVPEHECGGAVGLVHQPTPEVVLPSLNRSRDKDGGRSQYSLLRQTQDSIKFKAK